MVVFFFDTSAIIKRYIDETGTPWVQAVADSAANQIYLAGISAVEVTSALARRLPARNISATDVAAVLARFRQDRSLDYRIIDTTPAILADAERLAEAHALRANDAIQLASAVGLRAKRTAAGLAPFVLVSADGELNTASTALGLLVEDPNHCS